MAAERLLRSLYARASRSGALRRPLDALRRDPRVRAFARRRVHVLLSSGTTWANIDGALRLLAEDGREQVVFGPWRGDVTTELLYWAPFVRWAQEHFSIDPARLVVVSRGGVAHWYGDACGTYLEMLDGEGALPGAVFRPDPVLALVQDYRAGSGEPRPLLKRMRYLRLPPPHHTVADSLPDTYVAVALAPSSAFPPSEQNREAADDLIRALSSSRPVVSLDQAVESIAPQERLRAQHALFGRAAGLVAAWSGLALLGALSGVPVLALRSVEGHVVEPDVDMALRVVTELGGSLTVIDTGDLGSLASALRSSKVAGTVDSAR